MSIEVVNKHGAVTVTICGRFDISLVKDFHTNVLTHVTEEHCHVIVDMGGVEYMDSAALNALIQTLKTVIRFQGTLTLVNLSDAVSTLLKLTYLTEVFDTAPNLSEAMQRFTVSA